ncbi:3-phytase [Erythromicrobium ramosum]|uniref:Phytase n=1 Tax=Erythrobacter ramosus TaxID=35811 RepID=A0A6I4UI95_9SPHN|nr:phytase [Erythrobacter ramosus]MBB3774156.1 3-phytase [Erythrobacter ramosus]MXP38186.1 phytase [Erythrobacter ramosus]
MLRPFHGFALLSLGIAGACATVPPITGDPAVTVTARAETPPVGTAREDAADDPAIWRNPANPAASLVVGTDKKGGLYVYDLKGAQQSFLAAPGLNNVDLIEIAGGRVLVIASDRSDLTTVNLFMALLDTTTGKLAPAGKIAVGPGEGYGICMVKPAGSDGVIAFSAPKGGTIYRTVIREAGGAFTGTTTTLAQVPTQTEGCIADPRTGTLFIGEEDAGIWVIDMATGAKRMVAPIDNKVLVADVEGLAMAPEGENGGYLVASSQGDNAYAVFRLPDVTPVGRFRIAQGTFGSVEETDGIELDNRDFGPDFPKGIFIAQDGVNAPSAQNFKYVRWDEVLAALEAGR